MTGENFSEILTIDCAVVEDRWVVRLHGEVDVSSSGRLFDAAMRARDVSAISQVVVDFQGVTFVDPSGLHALVAVHLALDSIGRTVIIEGASSSVAEVLHLTGLADLFGMSWTGESALIVD